MTSWLRATAWIAVLFAMVAFSLPAVAKPSQKDRRAALKLGGEALDLYAAGDFEAALEKFEEADAIVKAPTLKLHIARCLDKLDRMGDAAEKYREVIATELKRDSPAVHRQARKEAVPELAALLEKIPTVSVVVKGPGAADAAVMMDGKEMSLAEIGEKMSLDPGHYRFDAAVGERKVSREIDLERGHSERVVLHLPELPTADPGTSPPSEEAGPGWVIAGYAALGVGVAGLAVGGIFGGLVLSEESDLEAQCPNRQCPPAAHGDAESFDDKRLGSTIGFVIGGVGVAAGLTILLVAPGGWLSDGGSDGADGETEVSIRPMIGPGYLGMEGSF